MCISKILFIDTEQLSKMQISSQVFLLIDSELPTLKMDFFEVVFENFDKFQNSYLL